MTRLKQDAFEQGTVLECVAQTPLVLAGTCDSLNSMSLVNDKMSHGSNKNSDAPVHNENLVRENNKFSVMI